MVSVNQEAADNKFEEVTTAMDSTQSCITMQVCFRLMRIRRSSAVKLWNGKCCSKSEDISGKWRSQIPEKHSRELLASADPDNQ